MEQGTDLIAQPPSSGNLHIRDDLKTTKPVNVRDFARSLTFVSYHPKMLTVVHLSERVNIEAGEDNADSI